MKKTQDMTIHELIECDWPEAVAVTITPQDAAIVLGAHNQDNRPLRKNAIANYARSMASGEWKITGQCIVFDKSGNLVNGQHRLAACVKAKVPFASLVLCGVEPETYSCYDTGNNRTFGQRVHYPKKKAEIVRILSSFVWPSEYTIAQFEQCRDAFDSFAQCVNDATAQNARVITSAGARTGVTLAMAAHPDGTDSPIATQFRAFTSHRYEKMRPSILALHRWCGTASDKTGNIHSGGSSFAKELADRAYWAFTNMESGFCRKLNAKKGDSIEKIAKVIFAKLVEKGEKP